MSRGLRQFLRFLLVGTGGLAIDVAFFLAMIALGSDVYLARAASAFLAVTATWWINKEWTFRSPSREHRRNTYPAYLAVQSGGLAVSYTVFAIVQTLFPGDMLHALFALASGSAAALLFNFVGARGIVFRSSF